MAVKCTTLQPASSVDNAVHNANLYRGNPFIIVFPGWSPGFAIDSSRAHQRDGAVTTHERRLR